MMEKELKDEYIRRARKSANRYPDVVVNSMSEVLSTGNREPHTGAWVQALIWVGPLDRPAKGEETSFDLRAAVAEENIQEESAQYDRDNIE